MKNSRLLYWIFTALLVLLMLFSGISGLINVEQTQALIVTHLGYPAYFAPVISAAKILGVVPILLPGFPRLREWAYAGFAFDLIMAIFSMLAVGDPLGYTAFLWLGLLLVFGSYFCYHRRAKSTAISQEVPALQKAAERLPER